MAALDPTTSHRRSALQIDVVAATQALLGTLSSPPHTASTSTTTTSSSPSSSALDALQSSLASLKPPATAQPSLPYALLLDQVANFVLNHPAAATSTALHLRPLLVDLAARLLPSPAQAHTLAWHQPATRALFGLLAHLVGPFEELYNVLYAFISLPALAGGPLQSSASWHRDPEQLDDVLLALYRLLSSSAVALDHLGQPWPSESLHRIFSADASSVPAGTRLLALEAFALQERLGQATRVELQQRWIGSPSTTAPDSLDGSAPDALAGVVAEVRSRDRSRPIDVWILAEEERRRISEVRKACRTTPIPFLPASNGDVAVVKTEADGHVKNEDSMELDAQPTSAATHPPLRPHDLCPLVCELGGVLLLRSRAIVAAAPSSFIETPSCRPALAELALHLSARLPVLLSGPPSCGKTELLSHIAGLLRPASSPSSADTNILTIQLGDQSGVDAKQLLGSFVSSPTKPGMFEWSEGALTRAVRLGMWVVLEDIDKAGSEVLSTVGRLVEQLGPTKPVGARPSIDLGSRGKVVAGDGFALFATRSTMTSIATATAAGGPSAASGSTSKVAVAAAAATAPKPNFLGSEHWAEVRLGSPTRRDVEMILGKSFARLAAASDGTFLDRLIDTWDKVRSATTGAGRPGAAAAVGKSKQPEVAAGALRTATLRDLIKWCRRVDNLLRSSKAATSDPFAVPSQQEEIFIEACDVFLGALPSPTANLAPGTSAPPRTAASGKAADRFSALVELLAEELGLSSERAWWALKGRTPELSLQSPDAYELAADGATKPSLIRVGRCQLARRPRSANSRAAPINRKFALTRPTLGLLERLAVATALSEPVLLVGETGTGKTTVVQHLASLLGRPMVALNLSQQTESGDLLGAFKPLDPKLPATELHDDWTQLFARTFSSRRNARFVDAERKAFLGSKWARLAGLWRESAKMASQRKRGAASAAAAAAGGGEGEGEGDGKPKSNSRKKRRTDSGATEGSPSGVDDADAEARLDAEWRRFDEKAREFGLQHGSKKRNLVFSFVEGPLVRALRQGDWVLLDEVNLAAAETLDCLSGLLQSPNSSITLTERGDLEPIPRHPDFRLFACMNPATDVGKKELPAGLRSRFTELYVPSPDSDRDALVAIVEKYIGEHAVGDRSVVMDVAECYAEIRRLAQRHELADGANQRPHYSIRTLSRALIFATDIAPSFGLRRGLWEGFVMAFTLLLESKSAQAVREIIERQVLAKAKNARAIATFTPSAPAGAADGKYVQVGPFWLETGPLPLDAAEDYVLTASVQAKLVGLSRAALTRRFPVLIQGPTSAGKTSAVEYLARRTGHRFVRINNHEHTDIQEYLGSYASDPDTGRLAFHEGLLVKALRRGDWIVLDELNLAPTDVLEALNRLLDDNRELVIPETGEVVRPHPHFMLFATQNPPGLYAGRKVLSRAFRNRFLELHFDDVPRAELETILTNRCAIAPSYATRIVSVFEELQKRRQAGRVFETKQAFVTLRDLFRWGMREAVGYQQLAENGYMLIAERARRDDDKATVKEVIESIMRVKIDAAALYDLHGAGRPNVAARIGAATTEAMMAAVASSRIVWTDAVQRLLCLVATALRYNEPVLLVGETGAGKTSVCEVLAQAFGRELHCVNCHQNTDTADLLGGQRPLRNRAATQAEAKRVALETLDALGVDHALSLDGSLPEDFAAALSSVLAKWPTSAAVAAAEGQTEAEAEAKAVAMRGQRNRVAQALQKLNQSTALFEWHDGPLVQAMQAGNHLLLDEISLADDSVLERLNSVLEPARTLVLAERSTASSASVLTDGSDLAAAEIRGADGFQVLATMNPGGDYGKKELSPALRNRFTEIWVPHIDVRTDLVRIVEAQWKDDALRAWTEPLLDFADWFVHQVGGIDQANIGLRDLLGWAAFMNQTAAGGGGAVLAPALAFAHGAALTIIDGLGALPATATMSSHGLRELRNKCFAKVAAMIAPVEFDPASPELFAVHQTADRFGVGPFSVEMGSPAATADVEEDGAAAPSFSFGAPTSASNAMRVLRALAVPNKALLLEGSPGAGKTSLISALAKATNNPLTRINLSDQTELVDLFGADLPVEGGGPGEFAWRDAAFLTAMQRGEWVLLDEMNLASQTVLEGLNSCLDHRGTVFLPELGRSFTKHPKFRLFAAQNPHHQGGGRKGLPKSFLNRFTKVHIEELTPDDIFQICGHLFPSFDRDSLRKMIDFNARLHQETMVRHSFGRIGAPWEFNLRDLLRWLTLLHSQLGLNVRGDPIEHLASLYVLRFRTVSDRRAARALYANTFGVALPDDVRPWPSVTPRHVQFGHALLPRGSRRIDASANLALLQHQLPTLEALADCLQMRWLAILTGPSGIGKTSAVRLLAQLAGARLEEFSMNAGTDTMDLLGTFEQYDPQSQLRDALAQLRLELEGVVERCGRTDATEYAQLSTSDRCLRAELDQLVAHKNHVVDHGSLLAAMDTLAAHPLAAQDAAVQRAIVHAKRCVAEGQQLQQQQQASAEGGGSGRFEWTDGPLLRALKEGHWLLLDNANLCSASVLDRLNSLFEIDGQLVISERGVVDGEVPVVRPHPDFRVFMALDTRHGELSRAMRNRGIEICMVPPQPAPTAGDADDLDQLRLSSLARAEEGRSAAVAADVPRRPTAEYDAALMKATIVAQAVRRGMIEAVADASDAADEAKNMANWAASSLVLRNSTLAASVVSAALLCGAQAADAGAAMAAASQSFLLRASSPDVVALLSHLLGRRGALDDAKQQQQRQALLALQTWSRADFVLQLATQRKVALVDGPSTVPADFVERQPIDLRYNANLWSLLSQQQQQQQQRQEHGPDGRQATKLELFAAALLQELALRSLLLAAQKKDKKALTIMEQSSIAAASAEKDASGEQSEQSTIRQIFPLSAIVARTVQQWSGSTAVLDNEAASHVKALLRTCGFLERLCASVELDYSSIQVLVQVMDETLGKLEAAGLFIPEELGGALRQLGGKVNLTSGFAMQTIWGLCLAKAADSRGADVSRQITDVLARMPPRSLPKDVALHALDIAATLSLDGAAWSKVQSDELLQLGRKTLQSLQGLERKALQQPVEAWAATKEDAREALAGSAADLSLQTVLRQISLDQRAGNVDLARMRCFVELLKQSNGLPLSAAVPIRSATWSLEATGGVVASGGNKLEAPDVAWIQRLWALQIGNGDHAGPAELFRPMLLRAVLESRADRVSLEHRTAHDASAKRLAQTANLSTPAIMSARLEQVRGLLLGFANTVSNALKRSIARVDDVKLNAGTGDASLSELAAEFVAIVELDGVPDESRAIAGEWSNGLSQAAALPAAKRGPEAMLATGQSWVILAMAVLRLYLPNFALDPVVTQQTRGAFNAFCCDEAQAQLSVEVAAESISTGRRSNAVAAQVAEELRQIAARMAKESTKTLPRRSDLKLLTQLYREMHAFVQQVLATSKLADLIHALHNGFDQQVEDREASLQASVLGFAHRLRQTFAALHDIVAPFLVVLSQVQLGFRTMAQASRLLNRTAEVNKQSKVLEALVGFPTAASTASYRRLELPVKLKTTSRGGVLTASLLLTSVSSIALDAERLGLASLRHSDTLRRISRTYDQLYQLWSLDRERERQAEEANASLYKSKRFDLEMAADAEAEEREFQRLFPEFNDVLDEAAAAGGCGPRAEDPAAATATATSTATLLKPPHYVQLYRAHMALFGDGYAVGGQRAAESREVYYVSRGELVRRIVGSHYAQLSEKIDQISAAFQVAAATSSVGAPLASPEPTSTAGGKFNFYLDPRPDEASKVISIVDGLRRRLSELIQEWPDQMVLQHIRDRCDALLRLDSASPVAKVLSALEQLLMHTEDWEGFASSQTSLKLHREQISGQIVEWRRLELSCWARILENQATDYEEGGVAEWWFRLFEVLVGGTRAASLEGDEARQEHVRKLIDSLDQFIRSSSIGQFEARLRLLDSFSRFLDLLVELAPADESCGFSEVGTVLKNVAAFFWQFHAKVATTLKQQRDILEKEIRNFIKLASWKDINVHALKTSAQKTHRQLHKCIRSFRDILRQPADPLLAAHLDALSRKDLPTVIALHVEHAAAKVDPVLWKAVCEPGADAQQPQHITNLSQTYEMLRRMAGKHLVPSLADATVAEGLSALSEEIVDRQQSLAKLTPAFSKEETEKAIKNLNLRKRKAWTELLKELRRIGLNAFVNSDVSKRNQDSAFVYTQEPLRAVCPASLAGELFESVEQFHFRLLAGLPKVRAALGEHSADLSTAELQRGVNYIEHCMSLVFGERKRISRLLRHLGSLETTAKRLEVVHAGTETSLIRSRARETLGDAADFAARLAVSLDEILQLAPRHVALSPFGAMGTEPVLAALAKHHATARHLASALQRIASDASSIEALHFLAAGEEQVLREAAKLVGELIDCLVCGEEVAPALSALLRPTRTWIEASSRSIEACLGSIAVDRGRAGDEQVTAFRDQSNRIISSILLVAQDLRKKPTAIGAAAIEVSADQQQQQPEDEDEDEGKDLDDKAVLAELERLASDHRALRSEAILAEIAKALSLADALPYTASSAATVHCHLARLSPFVHEYATLLRAHLVSSANWSRSLLKMSHVLCNLISALAAKGFCKPPAEEQQQDAEDGDNGEQLEGGTGLGDGSGAKDVTDQMEDDEPMEELAKDPEQQADEDEEKAEREKNAREADDDFGGDLEEIEQSEGEDAEEQDDKKEKEQPDDAVGDVDPLDPNAVDEKMWGNEDDKDDEDDQKNDIKDKTDKDAPGGDDDGDDDDDSVPKEQDGERKQSDSKQKKEKAGDKSDDVDKGDEQRGDDQEDQDGADGDEGDDQEKQEGDDEDKSDEEGEEEDPDAEQQPEGLGRRLDDQMQEGENLDLDEDLHMDEGDKGDEEEEEDGGDDGLSDLAGDDLPPNEDKGKDEKRPDGLDDLVEDEDKPPKDDGEEQQDGADKAEQPEEGDEAEAKEEVDETLADKEAGEEGAMDEDDDEDPEAGPKPDDDDDAAAKDKGDRPEDAMADAADQPVQLDDAYDPGMDAGEDASAQQEQSSRGQQGRRVEAQLSTADADDGTMDQDDEAALPTDQEASAGGGSSRAQWPQPPRAVQDAVEPPSAAEMDESNPMRSLGDALEEFRKRLDEIRDATDGDDDQGDEMQRDDEEAKRDGEGMPETGDVEHVTHDDNAESQALGAAEDEEDAKKLGNVELDDDDADAKADAKPRPQAEAERTEADEAEARAPMELEMPAEAADETEEGAPNQAQQKALMPSDIRPRLTAEQEAQAAAAADRDDEADPLTHVASDDDDDDESEHDPLPDEEREAASAALLSSLETFRQLDSDVDDASRAAKAADLWRSYTALTSDLAFSLCESLRLILAPTLATRLSGDYRTGKRLNMRKIVPFIASDFAKDKIWLRRTKPSKREYQVLLAIDDSRSMAESRAVHLAFQTLSLVAGALKRLEVGEVGIVKFGESVESLIGFEAEWNEAQGGKVVERLRFEQKNTDVLAMVRQSLEMLEEQKQRKGSGGAGGRGELRQLQIVVSDGICQDHEKVKAMVRRANEAKVVLVFVVVDSISPLPSAPRSTTAPAAAAAAGGGKASILDMNSVTYETDAAGRLQLRMKRYLDTFPFDYYVVVRDVEALPGVLVETLRQWAEKIREMET
ncbi:AAA ATPase midasin [Thecaphora frezii]